jgi:hypothetical protein
MKTGTEITKEATTSIDGSFMIKPELPIGTEFWYLKNSRMEMGLVAAYTVRVTSCVEDDSWHKQLWRRWSNKKAKNVWVFYFSYDVKLEYNIGCRSLEKKNSKWFLYSGAEVFFSVEELKASL